MGIVAISEGILSLLEGDNRLCCLGKGLEDSLIHLHRILSGTILAIDIGVGVRPDLLEINVAIPGDEVLNDNIHVVEIMWNLVDLRPAGRRPNSSGEPLEESIARDSHMVKVELILEGFGCHFVKLLTLAGSVVDNVYMAG